MCGSKVWKRASESESCSFVEKTEEHALLFQRMSERGPSGEMGLASSNASRSAREELKAEEKERGGKEKVKKAGGGFYDEDNELK